MKIPIISGSVSFSIAVTFLLTLDNVCHLGHCVGENIRDPKTDRVVLSSVSVNFEVGQKVDTAAPATQSTVPETTETTVAVTITSPAPEPTSAFYTFSAQIDVMKTVVIPLNMTSANLTRDDVTIMTTSANQGTEVETFFLDTNTANENRVVVVQFRKVTKQDFGNYTIAVQSRYFPRFDIGFALVQQGFTLKSHEIIIGTSLAGALLLFLVAGCLICYVFQLRKERDLRSKSGARNALRGATFLPSRSGSRSLPLVEYEDFKETTRFVDSDDREHHYTYLTTPAPKQAGPLPHENYSIGSTQQTGSLPRGLFHDIYSQQQKPLQSGSLPRNLLASLASQQQHTGLASQQPLQTGSLPRGLMGDLASQQQGGFDSSQFPGGSYADMRLRRSVDDGEPGYVQPNSAFSGRKEIIITYHEPHPLETDQYILPTSSDNPDYAYLPCEGDKEIPHSYVNSGQESEVEPINYDSIGWRNQDKQ